MCLMFFRLQDILERGFTFSTCRLLGERREWLKPSFAGSERNRSFTSESHTVLISTRWNTFLCVSLFSLVSKTHSGLYILVIWWFRTLTKIRTLMLLHWDSCFWWFLTKFSELTALCCGCLGGSVWGVGQPSETMERKPHHLQTGASLHTGMGSLQCHSNGNPP